MALTVRELKEAIKDLPDDMEIYRDVNTESLDVTSVYYKPKVTRVMRYGGSTLISMSTNDKGVFYVLLL